MYKPFGVQIKIDKYQKESQPASSSISSLLYKFQYSTNCGLIIRHISLSQILNDPYHEIIISNTNKVLRTFKFE